MQFCRWQTIYSCNINLQAILKDVEYCYIQSIET